MTSNFINKYATLITYSLVIIGLFLLLIQPLTWNITMPTEFWIRQVWIFSWWVLLFFINSEFIVPRLVLNERVGVFVLVMILLVVLTLFMDTQIGNWLNLPDLISKTFNPQGGPSPFGKRKFINPIIILTTLLILGLSTTIKVIQKWQKDNEIRQNLEKQRINTELSGLKAQINPHFFFNTLHSIYALTHLDIEKSREALHRLSRMMRYVIYETQSGLTSLRKEEAFLSDYIDLMKLRVNENVKVIYETNLINDLQVAPMLFLPFVENAFKHGVSGIYSSIIYVGLNQQGNQVSLSVSNTLMPEKTVVLEESSGIGLQNTRRRLDLLYPDRYQLQITEVSPENEYQVNLTLQLS